MLSQATEDGKVLQSAARNVLVYLNRPEHQDWEVASVAELLTQNEWSELNDRFYRTVEFGTGGFRGRTIGRVVTRAEQGQGSRQAPQYPAAGTNTVNFYTIAVATRGLMSYLIGRFPGETVQVAISFDTRLFSRDFARLAAEVISACGGTAHMFADVRPTPELSFAVRTLHAHAGIMVTASHNPPHDNGFKAYFSDGAQVVEPHASAIIEAVSAAQHRQLTDQPRSSGRLQPIDPGLDDAYMAALKDLVLLPDLLAQERRSLKVVYTSIHGTGIKIIPRLFNELGIDLLVVTEQATCDGLFPTVSSPNPENPEALSLAIKLGNESQADAIIATDPDCDRMGVAVRGASGQYEYLTGNQIGSVLAQYRLQHLFSQRTLTAENAKHAAIIKTLVTTELLKSIADAHGVKCAQTLTGFKHIGAKLRYYEDLAGGRGDKSARQWREFLLQKSTYNVIAAEESYGYLIEDYVRDKDAAGTALAFVELLAFAKHSGLTVVDLLNQLYLQHGYYGDRLGTLTFEGEEGATKISTLLASYNSDPPSVWADKRVLDIKNYSEVDYLDIDGISIPRELMLTFHLAGGCSVTTRASGTEPKIKFYFSAMEPVTSATTLVDTRQRIERALEGFWDFTKYDVATRVQSAPVK